MKPRSKGSILSFLTGTLFVLTAIASSAMFAQVIPVGQDAVQKIIQARDKLQEGWNTWNPETMKAARDQILYLILQDKGNSVDLYYYAALSEYRLVVHAFSAGRTDEAGTSVAQARKYLEKTMELQPAWGEPYAMYGTLLGYEIALNPSRGMELGMQTFSYFGQAESKDPQNPRVRLLKGLSLFYWPVEFGGGPDNALLVLDEAVALFEKEKPADPVKPTWGLEEALTFMARAYSQKGEKDKALDCLKKALAANPDFMLARQELKSLQPEK